MPRHDSASPAKTPESTGPRSRALRRRQSRASTARRLPVRTLRVLAVLDFTDPPIWRRLELASNLRLDELHAVLQAAFEWEGGHLHQFSTSDRAWDDGSTTDLGGGPLGRGPAPEPESKTRLSQVLATVGDRLDYLYDFGDSWEHVLTLEEIVEATTGAPRARVVDGERAAPPEDCGGVPGYEELVDALADPGRPGHRDLVEWYEEGYGGTLGDFDPVGVDIETLDRAVRQVVA